MKYQRLVIPLLLFAAVAFYIYQRQESKTKPLRVFILSSYHRGDICEDMQYQGVREALDSEVPTTLVIKDFWLDARHLSSDELALRVKEAVKVIKSFKPYLIITIDDAAFKVALQHFLNQGTPPYIVFSGVNKPIRYYNQEYGIFKGAVPLKNVTGVYEKIFSAEAVRFLDEWLGSDNYTVAVVYSSDMVGKILKEQLEEELEKAGIYHRIYGFFQVSSLSQLKKVLSAVQENRKIKAYFPFVMSIKNEKGNYISFTEVAGYLRNWIKKPDLFPNARGAAHLGLFGGVGTDFQMMGYQAGKLAAKLLLGEKIERIPMERAKSFEIVINLKRARECSLAPRDKVLNIADEVVR